MICFAKIQSITTLTVVTITKSYSINLVSDWLFVLKIIQWITSIIQKLQECQGDIWLPGPRSFPFFQLKRNTQDIPRQQSRWEKVFKEQLLHPYNPNSLGTDELVVFLLLIAQSCPGPDWYFIGTIITKSFQFSKQTWCNCWWNSLLCINWSPHLHLWW